MLARAWAFMRELLWTAIIAVALIVLAGLLLLVGASLGVVLWLSLGAVVFAILSIRA